MGAESLNRFIINQKIRTNQNGKIIDESIFELLEELEERKKNSNQKWINMGSY